MLTKQIILFYRYYKFSRNMIRLPYITFYQYKKVVMIINKILGMSVIFVLFSSSIFHHSYFVCHNLLFLTLIKFLYCSNLSQAILHEPNLTRYHAKCRQPVLQVLEPTKDSPVLFTGVVVALVFTKVAHFLHQIQCFRFIIKVT